MQVWEPLPLAPVVSIHKESDTAEVAAWVKDHGWRGSVVGRWIWVPAHQPGKELPAATMRAAGFGFSKNRGAYYHTCGVESTKPPEGRKRWGGQLERYHSAVSVQDHRASFDGRPDWIKTKESRAARRRKKA